MVCWETGTILHNWRIVPFLPLGMDLAEHGSWSVLSERHLFIYNRWNMCNHKFVYLYKSVSRCLLIAIFLSACSQTNPASIPMSTATPHIPGQVTAAATKQIVASPTVPAVIGNTQTTPTIAAPAANRLKPEDWKNWPVVPTVSTRARQIYQSGLVEGTDPAHFSKVGDCQAIKDVLLGIYDKPDGYTLRENAELLTETIHQFSGSFDRDGEAVQGGFNAASELTPLMSNPDICEPGETPLECEVRVNNPSILLISLEVWWNGRSPDVYEKNMRQIIDYSLSKGILPILSTKADNVEGDHSINLATARLAYEYDLPLWNWWKAAQTLPNRGLDPDRPDGFHISQEFAWPERSFTALQALDAVWREVRPEAIQSTATSIPTQSAVTLVQPAANGLAITAESVSGATIGLLPVDPQLFSNPAGFILLSTARRIGQEVNSQGIFLVDPITGAKTLVADENAALQAVSPDGRHILFSRGSDLYQAALDGSQPILLTNRFYFRGSQPAIYMPDGNTAVFLAEQDGSALLVFYPLDGSGAWKRLSSTDSHPTAIFPSAETNRIFWENGTCQTAGLPGTCPPTGVYVSGLDGSSMEYLTGAEKAGFSPDRHWLAYEQKTGDDKSQISLATIDLTSKRPQKNIGSQFLDFSWSPDGTKLSLLTLDRSDYSGQWLDIRNLGITPLDMGTKILPATSGMNPRAIWSADSNSLLLTGTLETDGKYSIQFRLMDAASGLVRDLTEAAGFWDQSFIYTTRIEWVKTVQ